MGKAFRTFILKSGETELLTVLERKVIKIHLWLFPPILSIIINNY